MSASKTVSTTKCTLSVLLVALLTTSGCGYFLYPERTGQTSGQIDPTVFILDGAALLFGIIPGVVSFAVDISTGTIYLPPGEKSAVEKHADRLSHTDFDHFNLDPANLEPAQPGELPVDTAYLAERLSQQLGQPVEASAIQFYTTSAERVALAP